MITIRPHKQSDTDFIYTSWANSYRPFCRWLPKKEYQRAYSRAINASLGDSNNQTWVACLEGNEDFIAGWIHGSEGIVHYVFVRPDLRRNLIPVYPIAEDLLARVHKSGTMLYTHWTRDWSDFLGALKSYYSYRPDCFRPNLPRKEEKK